MKVLFLTHTGDPTSGGWGRYTHDLKEELKTRGLEVVLLSECVDHVLMNPVVYLIRPWAIFRDLRTLRRVIQEVAPDVVHISVEPYLFFVPLLGWKQSPFVLTVHGTYAYLPVHASWWWRPVARLLYERGLDALAATVAVSEFTRTYLLQTLRENKVSMRASVDVIHNGINLTPYRVRTGPSSAVTRILTTAPVKERKGILETIEAVNYFAHKHARPFEWHIVGAHNPETPYAQAVAALLVERGLSTQTVFKGRLSEEDLISEYENADLFVMLPSTGRPTVFEGFGLVYLEANACGVPAIGSIVSGSAEAISDGVSGYLVDPRDKVNVAEKMHKALSGALDSAVIRAWAEEHTIAHGAARVLNIYKRCCPTPGKKAQ